ncbi:MAG: heme-binding domain-containing protein [Acidimicrobiia bacterium]|nr:heme-binding domain-containing protein [Acidimicrobiia bacterium]
MVAPIAAGAAWLGYGSIVAGVTVLIAASLAWVALRPALPAAGGVRIGWAILAAVATAAALIQFVPYGRDHTNPPITAEPVWDRAETRALAVRACYDCHSSETAWPWYTDVAPLSWLATNHVEEGRAILDFSSWDRPQHELDEMAETIAEGEMPPRYYTILHSTARLSAAEKQQLIDGLRATLAASPPG